MPTFTEDAMRRITKVVFGAERNPPPSQAESPSRFLSPVSRYLKVTSEIGAAVRGSSKLGKGKGKLLEVYYDSSNDAFYKDTGIEVFVYSGALSAIAVDRIVIADPIACRYHVVVDFCSG